MHSGNNDQALIICPKCENDPDVLVDLATLVEQSRRSNKNNLSIPIVLHLHMMIQKAEDADKTHIPKGAVTSTLNIANTTKEKSFFGIKRFERDVSIILPLLTMCC